MYTYKFEINETLHRIISIKANDEKETYEIARNMYREEIIVLFW